MRKFTAVFILITFTLSTISCGGMGKVRENNSFVYEIESSKSCPRLLADIQAREQECETKKKKVSSTTAANVAAGAVGVVLFWPLLFAMDVSGKDKDNLQTCRDELESMQLVYAQKGCGELSVDVDPIPEDARPADMQDALPDDVEVQDVSQAPGVTDQPDQTDTRSPEDARPADINDVLPDDVEAQNVSLAPGETGHPDHTDMN